MPVICFLNSIKSFFIEDKYIFVICLGKVFGRICQGKSSYRRIKSLNFQSLAPQLKNHYHPISISPLFPLLIFRLIITKKTFHKRLLIKSRVCRIILYCISHTNLHLYYITLIQKTETISMNFLYFFDIFSKISKIFYSLSAGKNIPASILA